MLSHEWIFGLVVALVYGAAIGSFLNVVVWRLPRGQSIAKPTWSYCPNCEHRLGLADLAPFFSFLLLGRKCRYCHKPISWRYIGVEAITTLAFVLVFVRYGLTWDSLFYAAFSAILVAVMVIDLEHFIIPDELNFAGVLVGLARNLVLIELGSSGQWTTIGGVHIPNALSSAVFCALIFHCISLLGYLYYSRRVGEASVPGKIARFVSGVALDYAYLSARFTGLGRVFPGVRRFIKAQEEYETLRSESGSPELTREEIAAEIENDEEQTGMGQGDAKLAAAIGANLYMPFALVSFFLAILVGGVASIALLVLRKKGARSAIPFGPYLVLGAFIGMMLGQVLLNWYITTAFPQQ